MTRRGFRRTARRLGLVLVALTAAACPGAGDGDGPGRPPERRFLSVGTAPPGGAFFVVGGALAEVLNEHGPEGWQITAEATKGSQENLRRLARGELDFALANAAITYFAVRGEAGWGEPVEVQAVMTLAPNVALFIAPASSAIRGLRDLKGRRVVIGPAGAGFEFFVRPILEAHGLTYADFNALNATQSGAVDLIADGAAAAAFLGGAVPTSSITQAASSQDIRFVPYDPGAIDALVAAYPFFDRATIPAGTYRGQEQDFEGLNVGSMHLVTRAGQDEELVYRVARTLWEQRAAVAEKHAAGRDIQEAVAPRDTGTAFHPGAVRFYREIGIWPEPPARD